MNALQAEVMPRGEVVQSEAGSLLEVISRAAADPSTDFEKLSRLMDLYERLEERQFERDFNTAMSLAQAEMEPVRKDATSDKGKYSSFPALDKAIRPIYTRHGFGLSFDSGDATKPDDIRIYCYATHSGGGKRIYHLDMPADGKGAKGGDVMTRTHAAGSAFTYGQRYLLKMIFNIAVGTDDDGKAAGVREQSAAVSAATSAINMAITVDDLKAWKVKNADGLTALPAADQDAIVRHFNTRLRKVREAGAA